MNRTRSLYQEYHSRKLHLSYMIACQHLELWEVWFTWLMLCVVKRDTRNKENKALRDSRGRTVLERVFLELFRVSWTFPNVSLITYMLALNEGTQYTVNPLYAHFHTSHLGWWIRLVWLCIWWAYTKDFCVAFPNCYSMKHEHLWKWVWWGRSPGTRPPSLQG